MALETSDERYTWLNAVQAVGKGQLGAGTVARSPRSAERGNPCATGAVNDRSPTLPGMSERQVVIVDAVRTPLGAATAISGHAISVLGDVQKALFDRTGIDPTRSARSSAVVYQQQACRP